MTETVAGAAQSDAAPATGETTSKTESMSDGPVSQAGQAAALSEKIIGINVGIVGAYKNGIQVPVTVTCQTTSVLETVELESVDSDGTPVRLSCSREKLKTETEGNVTRVEINFSPGHANGKLTVRCKTSNTPGGFAKTISPGMSEEDPAFRFEQPLPLPRPVVLVVGDDNIGLKEAFGEVRINENRRPEIRTVNSWKDLPQTPDGYEVVDTLVLTTTTPEILQDVTPEDPRAQAIFDWVRLGGKFVLIAGEHSIPLLSEHKVWKKFLPGKTVAPKLHEFRMANALVQAVPNAKNLVMTGSRDYPFLNVPVVSDLNPDMTIEIQEQETPLLTRWVCGLGTMTWFAAELSSPPLSNWSGRTVLVAKIFGLEVQNIEQKTTQNSLVQLGYHDISGELRSALDQFDGITIIPFSLILVLLFLYLLIVGPGDWYLTHHLLKRPNLTWLTLPFYVILFCVLTVAIVRHTRPREIQVNQVDLVDLDTVTGTVRGTTWCGVYSPKDAQYNLRFVPKDDFPIGE
ncbi:MAG: hypothetical protein IKW74_02820, partial [Thermoguttaceae bacterium]|nr:hypothetical protein [Thermoguttaceae bacterium]